jgi:hypothetical protein
MLKEIDKSGLFDITKLISYGTTISNINPCRMLESSPAANISVRAPPAIIDVTLESRICQSRMPEKPR